MSKRATPQRHPRLLVVVTDSISCVLLRGQLAFGRKQGLEVGLATSPGRLAEHTARDEGILLFPVAMRRNISPLRDLVALARLFAILRQFRPAIVNASTPKAGFLMIFAAWVCRVPCRVYTLRGLYVETSTGMRRKLFLFIEWATCHMAHRVICVSHSLQQRALDLGIVAATRTVVFGGGSSNGIDVDRFALTPSLRSQASQFRAAARIPVGARVVGFVGRLTRDKGLAELIEAWRGIREEFADVYLVLVGPVEQDALGLSESEMADADLRIHLAGHVDDPVPCYAAMDLLVLPSYREGFANVLLEAAAMELPVVATRATGCTDAVEDGVTGTLVDVRDACALGDAIRKYLCEPDLRLRHGRAGRERVVREFSQEVIWTALHAEYIRLLTARHVRVPCASRERAVG